MARVSQPLSFGILLRGHSGMTWWPSRAALSATRIRRGVAGVRVLGDRAVAAVLKEVLSFLPVPVVFRFAVGELSGRAGWSTGGGTLGSPVGRFADPVPLRRAVWFPNRCDRDDLLPVRSGGADARAPAG
ncbi:hypothetical protein GCM10009634_73440 [Saccharothrix xinjiangensis]